MLSKVSWKEWKKALKEGRLFLKRPPKRGELYGRVINNEEVLFNPELIKIIKKGNKKFNPTRR